MRWSYKIATIFKIPIRVHVSLVIFLGLTLLSGGGIRGLILMVAVFASVVAHELGHSLVARGLGLPIGDISLYPFGGMARLLAPPQTTKDEIRIAAAGPLVSLLLGVGFNLLQLAYPSPALMTLGEVNVLLGAFNLLPALPMDGGRIFRALLARKWGFFRATAASARVARYLALGIAVLGLIYSGWLLVLAIFLLFMSMAEEGAARARMYMGDPGYQDAPTAGQGAYNPFVSFAEKSGFKVSGTDWEVLPPEDAPSGAPSGAPGGAAPGTSRVYRDQKGNTIFVTWKNGR